MNLFCQGHFCQGSMPTPYRGNQCTMIAFYALAFAFLVPCFDWSSNTMDSIMWNGDRLYSGYIDNFMNGNPEHLAHDQLEILHQVSVGGTLVLPNLMTGLFFGVVGISPGADSIGSSLSSAIASASEISNGLLLTLGDVSVAVMVVGEDFFLFDSHSRDVNGELSECGSSVLLHFASLQELEAYIIAQYFEDLFNISPVMFGVDETYLPSVINEASVMDTSMNEASRKESFVNEACVISESVNEASGMDSFVNEASVISESVHETCMMDLCINESCVISDSVNEPSQIDSSVNEAFVINGFVNDACVMNVSCNEASVMDIFANETSGMDSSANEAKGMDLSVNEAFVINEFVNEVSHMDSSVNEASVISKSVNNASGIDSSVNDKSVISESVNEASGIDSYVNEVSVISESVNEASVIGSSVNELSVLESFDSEIYVIVSSVNEQSVINGSVNETSVIESSLNETSGMISSVNEASVINGPVNDISVINEEIEMDSYEISLVRPESNEDINSFSLAPDLDVAEFIIRYEVDNAESELNSYLEQNIFASTSDMRREVVQCDDFDDELNGLNYHYLPYEQHIQDSMSFFCNCCRRRLFSESVRHFQSQTFCCTCFQKEKSGKRSCVSWDNNMDPGEIPDVLKDLTRIERRFTALIHVFMTVFLLPRKEQMGTKGIAINIPATPTDLIHAAGSSPAVFVSFESREETDYDFSHFVSVERVFKALKWLKENNHLYSDIELPVLSEEEFESNSTCVAVDECLAVPVDEHVPYVQSAQLGGRLSQIRLPRVSGDIVNAYELVHGEEMCFPWLFCFGKAGYKDEREMESRFQQLYPKVRFLGKDDRFRKDMMYLLHFANVYEKRMLLNSVNIHMKMRRDNEPLRLTDLTNFDFLSNSYMFMKNVRGTAGYYKNELINLLAMIRNLGNPHLFLTFSPDEQSYSELYALLKGCSFEEASRKIHHDQSFKDDIKSDPVMVVQFLERKMQALMTHVINGPLLPLKYKVRDHFIRREFQKRGSVHFHILLWLEKFPDLNDADAMINYIDQIVCTEWPDPEIDAELYALVKLYQVHRHYNAYCKKNERKQCRFKFPFAPCPRTHLIPIGTSHRDLPYSMFYRTKRSADAAYINGYNPILLRHWRGNTDIKIVQGAHGIAMYVCYYLNKAEPDELKGDLSNLFTNVLNQASNMGARTRLMKIGSTVLKSRRMGCQEAAFKVTSADLISKSRKIVCLNTMEPKKRYRILKSRKELEELQSEDSENIFKTNMIDYYVSRPDSLEEMCLFEFAQWYEIDSSKNEPKSVRALPRFKIEKYKKIMKKRSHAAVVRSPKFHRGSNEYFYSLLLLFLPQRNCDAFNINSAKETFEEMIEGNRIKVHHLENLQLIEEIENAVESLRVLPADDIDTDETNEQSVDMFSMVHSENQIQENISMDNIVDDSLEVDNDISYLHSLQTGVNLSCEISTSISVAYDHRRLNVEQKAIFDIVVANAKARNPKCLFITGPGGTGKSYLIHCISQYLTKHCAILAGVSPVLKAGPTGICSKNIHGVTLHSLLRLPLDFVKRKSYRAISAKALKDMRNKFAGVTHLIIDEISMVSSGMLTAIHQQLGLIKENNDIFGGLTILAFGDFFQLRPVKGHYAFKNGMLWPQFEPYFLEESVRHANDQAFSELCKNVRIGKLTEEDMSLLKSRVINTSQVPFDAATHLFPRQYQVKKYNEEQQKKIKAKTHVIKAVDCYSCGCSCHGSEVNKKHIPEDDRDCGGLAHILKLSVGTKVILVKNLLTSSGLVNGADGVVAGFELHENGDSSMIYVIFSDPETAPELQLSSKNNAIAIGKMSIEFLNEGHAITRTMFPLLPSSGLTIHKMQGATKDTLVVDLGKECFGYGMAYVAISRCRTLNGLAIDNLDFNSFKVSKDVLSQHQQQKERQRQRNDKHK